MTAQLIPFAARSAAAALCLTVAALAGPAPATAAEPSITIEIVVAPNVINVQGAGALLTVHADIPYNAVDAATVELADDFGNRVVMDWCKADDRGDFVAKFVMDEVVAGLDLNPDLVNNLTLVGSTIEGVEFAGSDGVKVIDRSGR